MERRTFLARAAGLVLAVPQLSTRGWAQPQSLPLQPPATLLSAPIMVSGDWGQSLPRSALLVVTRMRAVALADVPLVSDRQPEALRVDNRFPGPPHIWLHQDEPHEARVVVGIDTRQWPRLAYQFGHELGHVMCNSWQWDARPQLPSTWVEEALVEAFSIRGLGLLADSWERDPPFPGNQAFSRAIRDYRAGVIERYQRASGLAPGTDIAPWFAATRDALDRQRGVNPLEAPALLAFVDRLEHDIGAVEDMGAVNRWPRRNGLPIEDYLTAWAASCRELGAPGTMPAYIATILGLGRTAR